MASTFKEACDRYSQFLAANGYPAELLWVTPQDVVGTDRRLIYVRTPLSLQNLERARALFKTGMQQKSGVIFSTLCETDYATCCYVWVPADEDERQRAMCQRDLKLTANVGMSRLQGKEIKSRLQWEYLRLRYRKQTPKEWVY